MTQVESSHELLFRDIQLPKSWKHFHPVFHNSLISPYNETPAHGPNFTRPPPEIVQGEDDHYEVESVDRKSVV